MMSERQRISEADDFCYTKPRFRPKNRWNFSILNEGFSPGIVDWETQNDLLSPGFVDCSINRRSRLRNRISVSSEKSHLNELSLVSANHSDAELRQPCTPAHACIDFPNKIVAQQELNEWPSPKCGSASVILSRESSDEFDEHIDFNDEDLPISTFGECERPIHSSAVQHLPISTFGECESPVQSSAVFNGANYNENLTTEECVNVVCAASPATRKRLRSVRLRNPQPGESPMSPIHQTHIHDTNQRNCVLGNPSYISMSSKYSNYDEETNENAYYHLNERDDLKLFVESKRHHPLYTTASHDTAMHYIPFKEWTARGPTVACQMESDYHHQRAVVNTVNPRVHQIGQHGAAALAHHGSNGAVSNVTLESDEEELTDMVSVMYHTENKADHTTVRASLECIVEDEDVRTGSDNDITGSMVINDTPKYGDNRPIHECINSELASRHIDRRDCDGVDDMSIRCGQDEEEIATEQKLGNVSDKDDRLTRNLKLSKPKSILLSDQPTTKDSKWRAAKSRPEGKAMNNVKRRRRKTEPPLLPSYLLPDNPDGDYDEDVEGIDAELRDISINENMSLSVNSECDLPRVDVPIVCLPKIGDSTNIGRSDEVLEIPRRRYSKRCSNVVIGDNISNGCERLSAGTRIINTVVKMPSEELQQNQKKQNRRVSIVTFKGGLTPAEYEKDMYGDRENNHVYGVIDHPRKTLKVGENKNEESLLTNGATVDGISNTAESDSEPSKNNDSILVNNGNNTSSNITQMKKDQRSFSKVVVTEIHTDGSDGSVEAFKGSATEQKTKRQSSTKQPLKPATRSRSIKPRRLTNNDSSNQQGVAEAGNVSDRDSISNDYDDTIDAPIDITTVITSPWITPRPIPKPVECDVNAAQVDKEDQPRRSLRSKSKSIIVPSQKAAKSSRNQDAIDGVAEGSHTMSDGDNVPEQDNYISDVEDQKGRSDESSIRPWKGGRGSFGCQVDLLDNDLQKKKSKAGNRHRDVKCLGEEWNAEYDYRKLRRRSLRTMFVKDEEDVESDTHDTDKENHDRNGKDKKLKKQISSDEPDSSKEVAIGVGGRWTRRHRMPPLKWWCNETYGWHRGKDDFAPTVVAVYQRESMETTSTVSIVKTEDKKPVATKVEARTTQTTTTKRKKNKTCKFSDANSSSKDKTKDDNKRTTCSGDRRKALHKTADVTDQNVSITKTTSKRSSSCSTDGDEIKSRRIATRGSRGMSDDNCNVDIIVDEATSYVTKTSDLTSNKKLSERKQRRSKEKKKSRQRTAKPRRQRSDKYSTRDDTMCVDPAAPAATSDDNTRNEKRKPNGKSKINYSTAEQKRRSVEDDIQLAPQSTDHELDTEMTNCVAEVCSADGLYEEIRVVYRAKEIEWAEVVTRDGSKYTAGLTFQTEQLTTVEIRLPPQTSKGYDTTGTNTFLGTVLESQPGGLLVEVENEMPRHMSSNEKFVVPPFGEYNLTNASRSITAHLHLYIIPQRQAASYEGT